MNLKTVNLDLSCYKDNLNILTALFKYQARKEAWSEEEISSVLSEAYRLNDHDHFIETITSHCEVKNDEKIDPKEVWGVLSQLGLHTHYLASKEIARWNVYDKSNYRALMIKAGKLKKVYGIYDSMINQNDMPDIESHPNFCFDNKEKAELVMQEMIADDVFKADEVHVLWRYKKV